MNEVIKSAHLIAIMVMIVTVRPNSERDVPTIEMTVSANWVAGGNSWQPPALVQMSYRHELWLNMNKNLSDDTHA